jgi:hypothetical protein
METATVRRPLLVAGLVLGMGLGGFSMASCCTRFWAGIT